MSKVENNQKVTLSYRLSDSEGTLLEEVPPEDAISYIHGYKIIFPKLEEALDGKFEGDHISLSLKAPEAFGEFESSRITIVDRKELDNIPNLSLGMEIAVINEKEDYEESPQKRDHFWTPQDPSDLFGEDDDDLEEQEDTVLEEIFTVKEIHELIVVLDSNHPFAGKDVQFEVDILKVEPASVEEVEDLYNPNNDLLD